MNVKGLKIALTTFPSKEEALGFVQVVVDARVAVCAQIDQPMTSVYVWQGRVEQSEEVRVWLKVFEEDLETLQSTLQKSHPYEIPQWVVLSLDEVSKDYLNWAKDVVRGKA